MISVDTIYQRVLAAANKEQRGYITPQEFNLFANQAQMDIFDQYFYDVDKASRVSEKEFMTIQNSPLTQPRIERPIYVRSGKDSAGRDTIMVFGHNPTTGTIAQITANVTCNYIRRPVRAIWEYVVVNGYAQYNLGPSIDFELHPSEENNLVYKILELAGIVMKDTSLYQIASQEEIKDIQQEKS